MIGYCPKCRTLVSGYSNEDVNSPDFVCAECYKKPTIIKDLSRYEIRPAMDDVFEALKKLNNDKILIKYQQIVDYWFNYQSNH